MTDRVVLPIPLAPTLPDHGSVSQNPHTDRDRTVMLSISAIAAVIIAYLFVFTVLRDPDMTAKLMDGVAPPGTDVLGNRVAVVGGIITVFGAWTAAVASRRAVPIVLVLLASVPFAPIALFTLVLAF